jgi:hypothetical protein
MKVEGELVTSMFIAIIVLVRALEAKGVFAREDYAQALEQLLEGKSQAQLESARYRPLQALLREMRHRRTLQ